MLLYFITTVTSQIHSARHHQRAGYSALPSVLFCLAMPSFCNCYIYSREKQSSGCVIVFYSLSWFEMVNFVTENYWLFGRKLIKIVC